MARHHTHRSVKAKVDTERQGPERHRRTWTRHRKGHM